MYGRDSSTLREGTRDSLKLWNVVLEKTHEYKPDRNSNEDVLNGIEKDFSLNVIDIKEALGIHSGISSFRKSYLKE